MTYDIVCTSKSAVPLPAGQYTFTVYVRAECGDNVGESCYRVPLTILDGDADTQNIEWGNSIEEAVENLGYMADRVYKQGDANDFIMFIQQALKELKYYDGVLTGNYGSRTESAVKQFQKTYGLPVTGECDAITAA